MSISAKAATAGTWIAVSAAVRMLTQVGSLWLLTKFLSPEDFGLLSLLTVIISLATIMGDMGLSSAIIQARTISASQRDSLFWVTALHGMVVAGLLILFGPVFAQSLGAPRLAGLLTTCSFSIVITSLGANIRAFAEKELAFRVVASAEILSTVVQVSVLSVLLVCNIGIYAFACSHIVASLTLVCYLWLTRRNGWRPHLRFALRDLRVFISYGTTLTANNLLNFGGGSLDVIIGGKLMGLAELGTYAAPRSISLQLQAAINPIVSRIALPVISHYQDDVARLRVAYISATRAAVSFNAFPYAILAVFPAEVISTLLGTRWAGSTGVLQILAAWGAARAIISPAGSLLFGTGRVRLALMWNCLTLTCVAFATWFGSHFGPIGLAFVTAALAIALIVPSWVLLCKPACKVSIRTLTGTVAVPLLLALISALLARALVCRHVTSELPRLILGSITAAIAYTILVLSVDKDMRITLRNWYALSTKRLAKMVLRP